jgi:hypothetical protein
LFLFASSCLTQHPPKPTTSPFPWGSCWLSCCWKLALNAFGKTLSTSYVCSAWSLIPWTCKACAFVF